MEYQKKKYTKCMDSIWNPSTKVTWPQYITELLIKNRAKFINEYKTLQKGPEWWVPISGQVRNLNQQASHLLSYFKHPEEDICTKMAIIKYLTKNNVCKIGAYRKDMKNATQAEKDAVRGIKYELKKSIELMNKISSSKVVSKEEPIVETTQKIKTGKNKWQKFQK